MGLILALLRQSPRRTAAEAGRAGRRRGASGSAAAERGPSHQPGRQAAGVVGLGHQGHGTVPRSAPFGMSGAEPTTRAACRPGWCRWSAGQPPPNPTPRRGPPGLLQPLSSSGMCRKAARDQPPGSPRRGRAGAARFRTRSPPGQPRPPYRWRRLPMPVVTSNRSRALAEVAASKGVRSRIATILRPYGSRALTSAPSVRCARRTRRSGRASVPPTSPRWPGNLLIVIRIATRMRPTLPRRRRLRA